MRISRWSISRLRPVLGALSTRWAVVLFFGLSATFSWALLCLDGMGGATEIQATCGSRGTHAFSHPPIWRQVLRVDRTGKTNKVYIKRRDLLRKNRLLPRDLRRIDPSLSVIKTSPSITIKDHALLVNLGGVRCQCSHFASATSSSCSSGQGARFRQLDMIELLFCTIMADGGGSSNRRMYSPQDDCGGKQGDAIRAQQPQLPQVAGSGASAPGRF